MVASKLTPEERLIKKRQAARLRQQRCRQRKRERAAAAAALAKNTLPQSTSLGVPGGAGGVIAPAGPIPHRRPYTEAQATHRTAPPLAAAVSASSSRSFDGVDVNALSARAAHAQAAYRATVGATAAPISPSPPHADVLYVKGKHGPSSLTIATPSKARAASALASISGRTSSHQDVPPAARDASASQRDQHQSHEQQRLSPQQAAEEKEAVDAILALSCPGPNGTPPMPPLDGAPSSAASGAATAPVGAAGLPPIRGPLSQQSRLHVHQAEPYEHERTYGARGHRAYPEDELYPHVSSYQEQAPYTAAQQGHAADHDFLAREDRLREEMLALRRAEHRLAQQQHELERRRYRHEIEARQRQAQLERIEVEHGFHGSAVVSAASKVEGMAPPVMGRGRVTQRPSSDSFYYTRRPQHA